MKKRAEIEVMHLQDRNAKDCQQLPECFPGSSDGKVFAYSARDLSSIPGSGRSPGKGNGNPFQYSCLEIPMDQGAWWSMGSQRVGHD